MPALPVRSHQTECTGEQVVRLVRVRDQRTGRSKQVSSSNPTDGVQYHESRGDEFGDVFCGEAPISRARQHGAQ